MGVVKSETRTKKPKLPAGVWLAGSYLLGVLLLAIGLPFLPLPFSPEYLDLQNPLLPPEFLTEQPTGQHLLGTDHVGRDVLVNLLYGFRTGFLIALPVMIIALLLGTFLGSVAAYFGNRKFKISGGALLCLGLWALAVLFYGFYLQPFYAFQFPEIGFASGGRAFAIAVILGVSIFFYFLKKLLKTVGFFTKKVPVPVDELVLKAMEVLSSVPRLVLILTFSALAAPGITNVLLLLSLTFWAGPARLIRAEVLKIRHLPYIEAAQVSGLTNSQILFRHILPNAAAPLVVAFSFGLSGLLGLEAALSFLGIGLPPEMPSWGRMLNSARMNPEAWWLLLFPALALCFTILSIQTVGNYFQQKGLKNR